MHQLSIGVLVASLLGFGVTAATAAPTTHLPPSPSALHPHAAQASAPAINAKKPAAQAEKGSLKQKAEKASQKKAKKKAVHNVEKAARRALDK